MYSVRSWSFFSLMFFFSLLYILFAFYFTNPVLIKQTILGNYDLNYKLTLLFALFIGLKTATSTINLVLLIIISGLTGANLAFLIKSLKLSKNIKQINFAAAGMFFGTT